MIPNGWRVDKVHPCGAKRLVNAQGHVTTQIPEDQPGNGVEVGECACAACGWYGPANEAVDPNTPFMLRCPRCGLP